MKIVVTNVFGSQNRGDTALVEILIDNIRQAFPGCAIEGIANQASTQRETFPTVLWWQAPGRAPFQPLKRLQNLILLVACLLVIWLRLDPKLALFLPKDQRGALSAIRNADLAISCAGGFLLDANVSIYMNLLQLYAAQSFGVPFILAPQTIGPINSRLARWITRRILKDAERIYTREDITHRFLVEELGISESIIKDFPDLALSHRSSDHVAGKHALTALGVGRSFIAVTAIDWAMHDGISLEEQYRYESELAKAINIATEGTDLEVLLVNQVRSDLGAAKRVAAKCSARAVVDDAERGPAELRGILHFASAMVASRFHSCIFAMLEGIHVEAISYNHKTDGIMQTLGLSSQVWPIVGFDGQRLGNALRRGLNQSEPAFRLAITADFSAELAAWRQGHENRSVAQLQSTVSEQD